MIRHSVSLWPLCIELARHLGMLRSVSFMHLHLFNSDLSFSLTCPFLQTTGKKSQNSWICALLPLFFFPHVCKVFVKTLPCTFTHFKWKHSTISTVSIKSSFSRLFKAESREEVVAVYHVMWQHTCHTGSAIEAKPQYLYLLCSTSAPAFYLCKVCVFV